MLWSQPVVGCELGALVLLIIWVKCDLGHIAVPMATEDVVENFFEAVQACNYKQLEGILQNHSGLVNRRFEIATGVVTPLIAACLYGEHGP